MITKFKIFETNSIWCDVESDFDDDEFIYIDGYTTNNDTGKVIAKINIMTGDVIYINKKAKTDSYAQEVIKNEIDYKIPYRRLEINTQKFNL